MPSSKPTPALLPDQLTTSPGAVNVLLFSQEGCPFCAIVRENYLKPMRQSPPSERIRIAEVELGSDRELRNWQGQPVSHAEFSRALRVRFAPTLLFCDSAGKELAERIVGLSNDFFGAYLDAAVRKSLAAP